MEPIVSQYIKERLKLKEYKIEEVNENTNVNFIYRLTADSKIYLKYAREFVKKLPNMKIPLDRQFYEAESMKLFHSILGDKVPEVIDLDEEKHILAVSDVENGTLLADLFKNNIFYLEAWKDLGKSLAKIHRETYNKNIWIRPEEVNKSFIAYLLPFRYAGALELVPEQSKNHLAEAEKEDTCIVWGDPLRKNIFQNETESHFFDFEAVIRYEPAYDIGYTLAELAVEAFSDKEKVHQCIVKFIEGYSEEFSPKDKVAHILQRAVKHMAAIMLHRTYGEKSKNSNRLDFKEEVRIKLVNAAVNLLKSSYLSPIEAYEKEIIKSSNSQ